MAVQAGAGLEHAPQDPCYGERSGAVRDPFGHLRLIGHNIEPLTPEEMQRRCAVQLDEHLEAAG